MKFAFYTLGCKVNQYETQAMEQTLLALGHTLGDFSQPCDCYIINTCTVTAVADKKNRAVIRRCRRDNPDAIIGVCGCYAQVDTQAVRALGVDVISGSGGREAFLQMMLQSAQNREVLESIDNPMKRRVFEKLPAGGLHERTRAMLKVQDGCSNFCTYCIIPYARGPVRSESLDDAVSQARALAQAGYRELVITGIEIASWGVDLKNGQTIVDLTAAICRAVPECRIRMGSLEPRIVDDRFCRELTQYPNLCPQFHLALQSGCDTVLRRMRRKYDTARFYESVELLKKHFPGCALTTDMIVAFPGETEEEFLQSLDFIRKCGFADMHIFPYSRRPGTPADRMEGQLPNAVKEDRSARAIAVAKEMTGQYCNQMTGSRCRVLFEEPAEGYFTGHAENYVRVYVPGENLRNQVKTVEITGPFRDGVLGKIAEETKKEMAE